MLYSFFSQGSLKHQDLQNPFCPPYALWLVNSVCWHDGALDLCFLLVQTPSPFGPVFPEHAHFSTPSHFWIPGAHDGTPVTLRVPCWHAGHGGRGKQRACYCKSSFWTAAPCRCVYCSRAIVGCRSEGMGVGTLCEAIFPLPPLLWNF